MKGKKKVPRAVAAKQQVPKPNPFELKGTKRKFDVLGKRDKGDKKNVIKSREEAVNKRKKTLLVEYKQLRKANTFIDRRFGEDDPRLNEEDKALARFQAQRIKDAKKAARFHLSDNSTAGTKGSGHDMLTHGGRSLEELEELNSRPTELLGDLDDDLLEDLVQQYHFGGGDEDGTAADGEEGQQRKTKKQIMEEIIAKSKAAKAEKAKQKEADEAALEALDSTFKELVTNKQGPLAAFVKPPGFEKGRKVKADTEEDAAYDRAARELVFEAKGQASERTLTQEELEEKEQQRLAALEAARLKRMKADAQGEGEEGEDDAASEDEAPLPQGGYAAKRARQQRDASEWEKRQRRKLDASGDALDENFALSDEEGEDESGSEEPEPTAPSSKVEARRQAQAAGDHPLQKAFREAAAKLAAKHGVAVPQREEGSDGSDDGEEEGSEGSEGSEEQEEVDSDNNEDRDAAAEGSESEREQGSSSEEGSEEEEGSDQGSAGSAEQPAPKRKSAAVKQPAAAPELEGPLDLPYTPPVPETYQEFVALVGGRPAEQLQMAIQRIRVFNAAAMATDNKRKLQVFYGILVQHFAMLAGQQPVPAAHLDVLTSVLLQLTPEVPFYAATVARTRLEKLHDKLAAALADPLAAAPLMGWPGARQLLQLRLFALLFPTSDKRHPVMSPMALLIGKHLTQCPVTCTYHAAVGLLLCGMALMNAAQAARFCPEVINFLTAAMQAFVPVGAGQQQQQQAASAASGVSLFTPGLLALSCCHNNKAAAGKQNNSRKQRRQQQDSGVQQQMPGLKLHQLLSSAPDAAEFSTEELKLQLLGCTVATANRACQLSSGCGDAAPEVLQPLRTAVAAVAALQGWPAGAVAVLAQLQQQLDDTCQAVVAARQPMVQSHRVKMVAPREFNPRYEADFSLNADYDPDRQRAAERKLQRQLVKEKRGAMRELRRDAAFMSAERDSEKARVDAERLASERAFYSELQVQEADAKSGGQRGMNPHKKKKKN